MQPRSPSRRLSALSALVTAVALLPACGGGGGGGGSPVVDQGQGANAGAGGSAVPSPSPSPSAAPASAGNVVQPEDVVYDLSANDPDSYKYAAVQCQGSTKRFWEWGGSSGRYVSPQPNPIYGSDSGTAFEAFSTTASPGEPGKSAFKWNVHVTDPDTSGTNAKRCEFSLSWKEYSYPGKVQTRQVGLPANKDIWWAVAIRQEDWSSTSSINDWQILWQWHESYGLNSLPPFLSLMAKGNTWQVQLVHDMNTNPTSSTLKKVTPWVAAMSPNTWNRFVVKARKDLVTPANGYVRVWLNGAQIVNYHGPFGYNVPQLDYAKVGIYKWISTANKWDPSMPARQAWSKGPVQVDDREGYTWQSIDALLD